MAVMAAAALLDELMGRNRNIAPSEKTKELNWEDAEFCKFYMVKFCPHDLFVNTRADLGACTKVHDDEAKAQFEKSTSYKKQPYEEEFIRFSQNMLNEVERKINKGKQRLALIGSKEPLNALTPAQTQRNVEQIALLSEKINSLVCEAEETGTAGNVEQAQGLMKLCDQLKEEREVLRRQIDNSHWSQTAELAATQEKQMEVCEVCGAFLIVGDAQSRIDDHLMGKQHMGYAKLRSSLDEIVELRTKQRNEQEKKREEERQERHRSRDEDVRKRDREREDRRKRDEGKGRDDVKGRGNDRDRRRDSPSRGRDDKDRERRERDEKERRRDRDAKERERSHRDERSSLHRSQSRDLGRDRDRDRERERDRGRSRYDDRRDRRGVNGDSGRRRD